MNRKEFLQKGFAALGFAAIVPIVSSCKKDGLGSAAGCYASPTETAGPYPTKDPLNHIFADIRGDRTGVQMNMKLTVQNINNSCAALAGVLVDAWHCDKDGNYSEYGNSASAHFLRGRQTTDKDGNVNFVTIFPGWYAGRAPHIHLHVYDASGKSLLVTQLAFPTDVCDTIYTTATNFYTRGKQDTSNTKDGIFSDSLDNNMCTVSGSVSSGYTLNHIIKVSA